MKIARMLNYRREFELPEGRVVIQALTVPLIDQTAELLASSFVTAVERLAPYSQYVRRNIVTYLRQHQAMPPRALVLIAVLQPTATQGEEAEDSDDGVRSEEGELPEPLPTAGSYTNGASSSADSSSASSSSSPASLLSGKRVRVIGCAEVSFNAGTRSSQPFLEEPERCCYLCNMAVSPICRRKGVASRLLEAAEEVASTVQGEREIFLHLRFVDDEAAALYESAGFTPRKQHWPIVSVIGPLLGLQRMKLMVKPISQAGK